MACCGKCDKKFEQDDCSVTCSKCKEEFHIVCVNVSKTVYKSFKKSSAFAWTCNDCSLDTLSSPTTQVRTSKGKSPTRQRNNVKNDCHVCMTAVDVDHDGFACGICHKWCHWGCADYDDDMPGLVMRKYSSRILVTCASCELPELTKMSKLLQQLDNKVNGIVSKLGGIQSFENIHEKDDKHSWEPAANSKVAPRNEPLKENFAEQVRNVLKQQAEEEVIQRSFIVSGLPETKDKSDIENIIELVHVAAPIIPLWPADIESAVRLGSADKVKDKIRPVKVTLTAGRKQIRNDIIRAATNLRKSSEKRFEKTFINPDKTREEQKEDYNLRCELRKRKAAGEKNLQIRNNKIVTIQPSDEEN